MTLPKLAATACARLQHEWEMRGAVTDLSTVIQSITTDMAPADLRTHIEHILFDRWMQLREASVDLYDE